MDKLRKSFRSSFNKRRGDEELASNRTSWQLDEAKVKTNTCSFEVKYLGCVEVFESRGMPVCEEALKVLKSSKRQPVRSMLHISGDGLRVVDSATQGLILDQTIEKVSFCAPDRNYERGFSYICRDGTTRRWICHGFMAVGESGERLSHAVGCAFAICLEKKQQREKECAVQYHYNSQDSTFTRFGSFRQGSITERLQDPQTFKPSDPPPPLAAPEPDICPVARPRASDLMFLRQASYRGLGRLAGSSPFKRQYSLRLDQLPSTLERQQGHSFNSLQLPPAHLDPQQEGASSGAPVTTPQPISGSHFNPQLGPLAVVPRQLSVESVQRRSQIYSLPSGIPGSFFSTIQEYDRSEIEGRKEDSEDDEEDEPPFTRVSPPPPPPPPPPLEAFTPRLKDPFSSLDAEDLLPLISLPPPLIKDPTAVAIQSSHIISSENSSSDRAIRLQPSPPPPLPPNVPICELQRMLPTINRDRQAAQSKEEEEEEEDIKRNSLICGRSEVKKSASYVPARIAMPPNSLASLDALTRALPPTAKRPEASNPWDDVPDQPIVRNLSASPFGLGTRSPFARPKYHNVRQKSDRHSVSLDYTFNNNTTADNRHRLSPPPLPTAAILEDPFDADWAALALRATPAQAQQQLAFVQEKAWI